jgi:glutathione S-transferase
MTSVPLELFWISGSPYSWRVMLTLELKQIPYTARLLEASKGEHQKPGFLALNPRGKVPVLRDGEVVVRESLAIMQYLERKYPAKPMFGRTPQEAGAIARVISEFDAYLRPSLMRVATPILFRKSEEKSADIRAAISEVHGELEKLEEAAAHSRWLAGNESGAADSAVYPFLKVLLRAAAKPEAAAFNLALLPFENRYPALAAWMGQVEGLSCYDRTYPPHWRETAVA